MADSENCPLPANLAASLISVDVEVGALRFIISPAWNRGTWPCSILYSVNFMPRITPRPSIDGRGPVSLFRPSSNDCSYLSNGRPLRRAALTEMAVHLIQEAQAKGSRVTFVVDGISLAEQTSARLSFYGIAHVAH